MSAGHTFVWVFVNSIQSVAGRIREAPDGSPGVTPIAVYSAQKSKLKKTFLDSLGFDSPPGHMENNPIIN